MATGTNWLVMSDSDYERQREHDPNNPKWAQIDRDRSAWRGMPRLSTVMTANTISFTQAMNNIRSVSERMRIAFQNDFTWIA